MSNVDQLRAVAREAIHCTIASELERDPALADDLDTLFRRVSRAYPFKTRKHDHYDIWLDELAQTRATLKKGVKRYAAGIDRPCPACRAKPGKPCISVGENDNLAADFMNAANQAPLLRGNKAPGRIPETLKRSVMHEVRLDPSASLNGVVSAA